MKWLLENFLKRRALGGLVACLLLVSCGGGNGSIMLVRQEPPSFGYQRLASQSQIYPDLGAFVGKKGTPDFLAETHNRQRHYFILYYLEKRQAIACRSRAGEQGLVEFAGPYPITKREYRLLDGFRKDPTHVPQKF
jgi:hypothetical protein